MLVLGISAFFHDSAAAIFKDGKLLTAVQEERFSRLKFDAGFPVNAIRYCLGEADASPADLDCIAYFELGASKLSRILKGAVSGGPPFRSIVNKPAIFPGAEFQIRDHLDFDGAVRSYSHHFSHAAHALGFCPHQNAAIIVADAVGESRCVSIISASPSGLTEVFSKDLPHSLGLFYSAITAFLGFSPNRDEYNVMGLAAYGRLTCVDKLSSFLRLEEDDVFSINPLFLDIGGMRLDSPSLATLLQRSPRQRGEPITQGDADIARSAQELLEQAMLRLAKRARTTVAAPHLCLAGGVALNCTANQRVRKEAGFESVWVPPGAGDAGSAIGAGRLAQLELNGSWPPAAGAGAYLGPHYSNGSITAHLRRLGIPYHAYSDAELAEQVAELLVQGNVIGWFEGRMEFGPRALGARSILADPRRADMRDRLNLAIKKRENFRPFAPVALQDSAASLFEEARDPYMTFVTRALDAEAIPAAVHIDGTSRLQVLDADHLPRLNLLLEAFKRRTGLGCLLNTSFNVADEPIVCSPTDALSCFRESGVDALILERNLVIRNECPSKFITPGARRHLEYSRELCPTLTNTYSFT